MKNFILTLGVVLLLIIVVLLILGFFTIISWNTVLIVGFSACHLIGLIFGGGLIADIMSAK